MMRGLFLLRGINIGKIRMLIKIMLIGMVILRRKLKIRLWKGKQRILEVMIKMLIQLKARANKKIKALKKAKTKVHKKWKPIVRKG